MVARASQRSRQEPTEVSGPGYRAFAASTRPAEPPSLLSGSDQRPQLLLLDRACGHDELRLRESTDWSESALLDGIATAAIGVHLPTMTVSLYRDLMGQRPLVYARIPGGLIVASGEDILRAHPAISGELDDSYLAAFFAGLSPAPTETAFRDVRQVPAGALLRLDPNAEHCAQTRMEPDFSWTNMADQAVVEDFGQRLRTGVELACQGAARVGLSLSAGLDSSSIAALARRHHPNLFAVTQGLPDYPDIDETAMAAEFADSLQIQHHSFPADRLLPFAEPELHPVSPNHPAQSPFRAWKEVSYRAMSAAAVDLCLDGGFADDLFAGDIEWVVDAIRFRRWRVLGTQLAGLAAASSMRSMLRDIALRRPVSRLLGRVSLHSERLAWLRPAYRCSIEDRLDEEARAYRDFPRPQHCMRLMGAAAAFDASAEQWYLARHGLEQRQPFRDPNLTRWCLSLPADFFTRNGQRKWVLREAMRGLLPESLRNRKKSSDLTPVFRAAVGTQRALLQHYHQFADAGRQRYLNVGVIDHLPSDSLAIAHWLASSFGYWIKSEQTTDDPGPTSA